MLATTRLPSTNPRLTTCKCVYLVMHGHLWFSDKDGRHTIQSATAENPTWHTNFMAQCFIKPELLLIEVLHCSNRNFLPFCSCDLDLDPMTCKYELDPYCLEVYRMCKYELPTSRLSKVIIRQTDRHDRNYIPRCSVGGQW